ncbi:magnesium chelatase subunit D family protein [Hathewaya limosa]|uniref:Magnesium chelatase subunit D n=1 Tax=Hathewaya limosa TaxID=1536 RepID=A0ABU0JTT1_HATLI|nr:magnesium chelatase subunit D family protein [Hathewaya limosa]MDQ0480511.1 magnesium chelatase subunit D [Hathewaya limosa]
MNRNYVYPFVAVIGQEDVKKALILNLINPLIGGVLITGEKGTAKSTLVRGLEKLEDSIKVIDLPLNITEDRLLGTIDIEKAISQGEKTFEGGILEKANGNILYVDEINLLSKHIVNCLLEVASSGVNRIEREGISYIHESRFVLVGTMNPEEGQLPTQLLDRFGLYVSVKSSKNIFERKEIIKRRIKYEENPIKFIEEFKEETYILYNKIKNAKNTFEKVKVSEEILKLAAEISEEAHCEGHRAELVIIETSKAIAAFDNRINVTSQDVKEAAKFALPHRMRDFKEQQNDINNNEHQENTEEENKEECENQEENQENESNESQENTEKEDEISPKTEQEEENELDSENEEKLDENYPKDNPDIKETIDDIGEMFKVKTLHIEPMDRKKRNGTGKRARTKTNLIQGRYVRYTFVKDKVRDLAFDATLRAAAIHQKGRDKNGLAICINKSDFREKVREKRTGSTILFVVDASGSMGAKKRMKAVKGAIISLLTDAYEKRDKVGMIAFRKDTAEELLPITRSVELAEKSLKSLPTGGKTPLSMGLNKAYEVLKLAKKKDPEIVPVIVLVSDGRTNVALNHKEDPFEEAIKIGKQIENDKIQTIVVDTEQDFIKLELAKELAEVMNSQYYKLEDLKGQEIASAIRDRI